MREASGTPGKPVEGGRGFATPPPLSSGGGWWDSGGRVGPSRKALAEAVGEGGGVHGLHGGEEGAPGEEGPRLVGLQVPHEMPPDVLRWRIGGQPT